ncbi:hypothetical protein [Nostoc sp. UHCC 0251]|uniref:hypothetical protein n=1 Tax=Nostoc sp. UHCC 0251 TaxID=3110240 RepID=UPI002B21C97A|nr:hypothetical protein [Nostoc sp. UHCC 0251]MEA5626519.1 hypothetical protein [Nostoc sp. UHCC 0251]
MKSIQISPMFISLTESEEESLCGGETLNLSNGLYEGKVIKVKGSSGKKGAKKQTGTSSTVQSTTKVVQTTKDVKISEGLLDELDGLFSYLSIFDW